MDIFRNIQPKTFPAEPSGNSYVQKTLGEDKWMAGKAQDADKAKVEEIKGRLTGHYQNIVSQFETNGADYYLAKLLLKKFLLLHFAG